jgi:hypothetical protein
MLNGLLFIVYDCPFDLWHICLRYKLAVKSADEESVVDIVLFGNIAKDFIGKPADILVNQFLMSNVIIPLDNVKLTRKSYVVEVALSCFSFRQQNIDFQVLKFYSEGGQFMQTLCRRVTLRVLPNHTIMCLP